MKVLNHPVNLQAEGGSWSCWCNLEDVWLLISKASFSLAWLSVGPDLTSGGGGVVLDPQAAMETRLTEETQSPAEEHIPVGDSGSPQSSQVISRRTRGRTSGQTSEVTRPFQTAWRICSAGRNAVESCSLCGAMISPILSIR